MDQPQDATNIDGVRNHLLVVFNKLRNGSMEAKDAVEINNTAGKIISSLKVQLAYHAMRGEQPEIEFLNCMPTTRTLSQKSKQLEAPEAQRK